MDIKSVVVDDDEDIRRILRRMMTMAGVEVVAELTSGEEAVDWIAVHDADVMVMDVQMAGMGGPRRRAASKRPSPRQPSTASLAGARMRSAR